MKTGVMSDSLRGLYAITPETPDGAHLLLVGDTDQLPSVGAGNVLKDLIATSDSASGNDITSQSKLESESKSYNNKICSIH